MNVYERIQELVKSYKELRKNTNFDGIIYIESSSRFPNGKKILCESDVFIKEFGDCEIDNRISNSFKKNDNFYHIVTLVDYIDETERIIHESPIIVGNDFAIEMISYSREINKEYLLKADFQNEKFYSLGKMKNFYYSKRKIEP